jgi:biopolymer transport protein ExbB/TolQ
MATQAQTLDAVLRNCRRSAAVVHCSMMRNVTSLATIAVAAPFLGFLGTVLGIIGSFRGTNGPMSSALAALNASLSDAVVATAFGLLVAVPAFCFYKYLRQRVEAFDVEMETAGLELVNLLSLLLAQVRNSA